MPRYALIRQPHTKVVRGGCLTGTAWSAMMRGHNGPKFKKGGHSATKNAYIYIHIYIYIYKEQDVVNDDHEDAGRKNGLGKRIPDSGDRWDK